MANQEHIEILKKGRICLKSWTEKNGYVQLDLENARLQGVDLSSWYLDEYDNTPGIFTRANFKGADLEGVSFSGQNLFQANFKGANLSRVNLEYTFLNQTNLTDSVLKETKVAKAEFAETILAGIDLSQLVDIEAAVIKGPSILSIETLRSMKGYMSPHLEKFFRGCGLLPWEIELMRLYDPLLTAGEIAEILSRNLFEKLTKGPLNIGGVFISYSQEDWQFAEHLYNRLYNNNVSVWLDKHDMVAGDIQRQVIKAIRLQDVVIIILSQAGINSDWVEYELETARKREKEEGRNIICPIALDSTWETKMENVLWRQLKSKYILNFSGWQTGTFDDQFARLINGLKLNYFK